MDKKVRIISEERKNHMNKKEKVFSFPSTNGINKIHAILWKQDSNYDVPKGIVQISHGMIEYIERYRELAAYLNSKGFLVVGNDHLGHGLSVSSEKDWGYFSPKNGSTYVVRDLHRLTKIIKKQYPNIPYFLLGHSMGSFMARRYIIEYGKELNGVLLLGTGNQPIPVLIAGLSLVKIAKIIKGERYRSQWISQLMFGQYNKRIPNATSRNDWVTSDMEILEKYNHTKACNFLFTLNGFDVLLSTLLYIEKKEHIRKIPKKLRVLLLAGKEDPVGNYGKAVKQVYHEYKKEGIYNIKMRLFEHCRHELHNEKNRAEVYQYIAAWLDK